MHNEIRSAIQSKGDSKNSPPKNPGGFTTNSKRAIGIPGMPSRPGHPHEPEEPRSHKQCKTERAIMERIDSFMQENPPEKLPDPRPNSVKWEYNKTLLKTPTPDFFDGLFTYLMGKLEGAPRKYDAQSGKIFRTIEGMGYPKLPQNIYRGITQAENWPEGLRILDWLLDLIDECESLRHPILPMTELPPQTFEGALQSQLLYALDQSTSEVVEAVQQRILGDLGGLDQVSQNLQAELASLTSQNEQLSLQRVDNTQALQVLERTTDEDHRLEGVKQSLLVDVEKERNVSLELHNELDRLKTRAEAIKRDLVQTTEALVVQDMTHADLENFKKDTFELAKSAQIFEEEIKGLEAELRLWDMKMKDLVEAARLHLEGIAHSGVLPQVNQKMIAEEVLVFENPNPGALHHLDQLERILDRESLKLQDQIADNQNRKLAAEVVARNLEIERAGLDRRIEELENAISREKEEVSKLLDKESGVIRDLSALGSDLETQKRTIAAGIEKGTREVAELEQERAKARAQLEGYLDDLTSAKRGFEAAKRELFDTVLAAKERLMAVLKLRVQLDVEVNQKTHQFCQEFIQEALEGRAKDD